MCARMLSNGGMGMYFFADELSFEVRWDIYRLFMRWLCLFRHTVRVVAVFQWVV